jgi:hypothetical protein
MHLHAGVINERLLLIARKRLMPSHTPPVQPEDRIALRLDDAATISGLSRSSLYNLLRAGKLETAALEAGG